MVMVEPTNHDVPAGAAPDDEIHLRDVWDLLLRNRWILAASVVLCTAAAGFYTWYALDEWRAVTSIRIEEEQSDLPVLDVLRSISSGSQVETEMEVLRSRTLAEEVVDSLDLHLRVTEPRGVARVAMLSDLFVERWAPASEYLLESSGDGRYRITDLDGGADMGVVGPSTPAALRGATFTLAPQALDHDRIVIEVVEFERAVERLREAIGVSRPNREAGVVHVSYEATDTQLVHRVPNTLALSFMARRQDIKKTQARSTVAFLEEQIDTLSGQLLAAEEALTAYRQGEQVVNLQAEATAQVTQLAGLQGQRNQLDAERGALQALVDEIRSERSVQGPLDPSPFRRLISFPSLFRNQATSELLRSLNEMEDRRAELLRRRTLEDPDVESLTLRIRELEEQLRGIATTYLQGLTNQVRSLDQTLTRFGTELERIPGREVQFARLERERSVLEEVYTLLQNRLQEARIVQAVEDPSVRLVDPASRPRQPVRPKPMLNILLGFVLGGMLGVGLAVGREVLDDTVHTREDLEGATGAVLLGLVPTMGAGGFSFNGNGAGSRERELVVSSDPRNPVAEAYRSLRTNLTFASPDSPLKTLVVTSALPEDGKSTSATNLAISLAQQGHSVLLVDADLRRGRLDKILGEAREPGLSNLLVGQSSVTDTILKVDMGHGAKMSFLPAGPHPPNPAELLGSSRMGVLLERLKEHYDYVIVDSPPLTMVTDAALIGAKVDGVLIVARANVTEKG
ncbi:MAG: polysaccharide biosynthesis tyrosine autokinase, partial [Gemmatimonadetes bacterium]|nr:polysaccharide biosynthesis tyrosine autokinase [Gemmatimonadota bacterium]